MTETVSTERLEEIANIVAHGIDLGSTPTAIAERILASRTQEPAEWQVEAVARYIAEKIFGSSWAGLGSDGRVTDRGFPVFHFSRHGGICCQGRQGDLMDVAREALRAATPPVPERKEVGVIPCLSNCGKYLAQDNTGNWHYLNHAGTWQGFQGPQVEPSPIHKGEARAWEADGAEISPLFASPVPLPVTITPEGQLSDEILAELVCARTKFPGKNVTFAALVEEVGELATATFEEGRDRVRKEAVQVAVMAMRMVLDGDHTFDAWRESKGLDPLTAALSKPGEQG